MKTNVKGVTKTLNRDVASPFMGDEIGHAVGTRWVSLVLGRLLSS